MKLVCLRPVVLKPSKERIADIVKFVQGLGPMDARTIIRSHPQVRKTLLFHSHCF